MQVLSETSPIIVMELISPGALLLLSTTAKSTSIFSASSLARDTPPTSGETIVIFLLFTKLCLISIANMGDAYRLSTGISKKPWIWAA